MLLLTDYNSRMKCERNNKLQMHGEMDPHYRWRVTPTSGIVRLHANAVDYS